MLENIVMHKILIALIWLTCFSVLVGFFQAFGAVGFLIMIGIYYYIMDQRKKGKIWNKD
tara:strand:- start:315 stop:491 length:177 start_codon:yes stop_codon:yes gene_type:complete